MELADLNFTVSQKKIHESAAWKKLNLSRLSKQTTLKFKLYFTVTVTKQSVCFDIQGPQFSWRRTKWCHLAEQVLWRGQTTTYIGVTGKFNCWTIHGTVQCQIYSLKSSGIFIWSSHTGNRTHTKEKVFSDFHSPSETHFLFTFCNLLTFLC